ncbi:MAG: tRNA threonylcarbamoyladenosine dehydratase [Candidatus Omnitrophica bacterium]|nr:tRNA threonylcarbamoyladenosine dehydratase [Candidatus Omnitrophota bacterium]
MEQFSRTELLIGKEGLQRLHNASVTIIGLGAVGSYCAEALARAGVGHFRCVDFDVIRPSNINRHIWAFHSTLGIPKAEMARRRILDINPQSSAEVMTMFADIKTMPEILQGTQNIIVDAVDSLNPKAQVLETCWRSGATVISSMGAATRTDPLALRTGDLMDTTVCPLAKRLRKMLKDRGVGRGIHCVYSIQQQDTYALSAAATQREEGELDRGRLRRKLGSLSTLTGIFGLTLAHVTLKHLLSDLSCLK